MQGSRILAQAGLLFLFLFASLAGCDRHHPALESPGDSANGKDQATANAGTPVPVDPRMQQTFGDATRQEPPPDWQRPPDLTLTGKSVGKLYTQTVAVWETIRFTSASGKPLAYRARLDTELGEIVIDLRPDLAPNHVRNFVALALVHYYDGLEFERTVHARSQEEPATEVEILEGGCPLGTGELGVGSIGYWLKAEFSKEPFDIGTVAACHGEDPDSGACRFFMTLSKAPFLDGHFTVFGKVTSGLDVARRIFTLPVRNDPAYPEGDRPEKAVVIRSMTIETSEPGTEWQTLSAQ
jgi:cyclophilin family peptidyl-prolyl cis-trans isomerase